MHSSIESALRYSTRLLFFPNFLRESLHMMCYKAIQPLNNTCYLIEKQLWRKYCIDTKIATKAFYSPVFDK